MILLIDNFDSFSYNLYQLIGSINQDIKVIRNNDMTPDEIEKLNPSHIIISPGPKKPSEAGNCIEIIRDTVRINLRIQRQLIDQQIHLICLIVDRADIFIPLLRRGRNALHQTFRVAFDGGDRGL